MYRNNDERTNSPGPQIMPTLPLSSPKQADFANTTTPPVPLKGPPKTSRFYRFFTSDSVRRPSQPSNRIPGNISVGTLAANAQLSASSSKPANVTHHYNPYIYPQNRNRVNPPPDFLNNRRSATADIKPSKAELIPILHPTKEQFKDPISYIESMKDLGEKYGAVKIVPPGAFTQKFAANLESLWFKTKRQLWNSQVNELNSRYEFYVKLVDALKGGKVSIGKLPCIDKRSIDLWRLHKCVQLRGGFQKCCGEKMWAQVGRELGFYGKITSSLSSSIKSAYQRYVLPLGLEDVHKEDFRNKDYIGFENKRRKLDGGSFYLPRISGSAAVFKRSRKRLLESGFNPYFDQGTNQKRSISVNDDQTFPCYDFYNWHQAYDVEDTSPFQTRVSSLYNIRQCNEKSRVLKKMTMGQLGLDEDDPRCEDSKFLEDSFWKVLDDPESVLETEAAFRISTRIHESGFESKPTADSLDPLLNPWNLHNLPVCKDSMLQYLQMDADSVLIPSLTFGMFYSVQCWAAEDHWLYSAEYEHMGDKKLCYFIPPRYREKYETLLSKFLEQKYEENKDLRGYYDKFERMVDNSDVYLTTVENRVLTDILAPRRRVKDHKFERFMEKDQPVRHVNEDIFLSPDYLRSQGVEVYGCFQEPGEFVVKFPQSYGSVISMGMSVSETVNFATPSWLEVSEPSLKWLQKQQIIPNFSNFRLLIDIAKSCSDKSVLETLKPVLEGRIDSEIQLRENVRKRIGSGLSETSKIDEKLQKHLVVTDSDMLDSFPSFVSLTDRQDPSKSQFTMSLQYFLDHYDGKRDNSDFKVSLVCYLSDEGLKTVMKNLKLRMLTGKDWLAKYERLIVGYDKPPAKILRPLVSEGETIFASPLKDSVSIKAGKYYENLKKEIELTDHWVERANKFLQYKVTSRMRQKGKGEENTFEDWNSIEELDSLLSDIPRLPVSTPEMDQLIDFAEEIRSFNRQVESALKKDTSSSLSEVKDLYLVGQCFGVKLNSFFLLDRILKRYKWLETFNMARQKPAAYDLQDLIAEGEKVGTVEDSEKIRELKEIVKKSVSGEIEARQFMQKDLAVSGNELRACYERVKRLAIDPGVKHELGDLVKEYENVTKFLTEEKYGTSFIPLRQIVDQIKRGSRYAELNASIESIQEQVVGPIKLFYEKLHQEFPIFPEEEKQLEDYLVEMIEIDQHVFNEPRENHDYCVCRERHEDDAMIECETCKEWFHFKCIGLQADEENPAIENLGYLCPICDYDNRLSTTRYHWEVMNGRPDVEKLGEIVKSISQDVTPAAKSLKKLYEDAKEFRETFRRDLKYEGERLVEEDSEKVRFVLRQLGGSAVNFAADRTEMKQRMRELKLEREIKEAKEIKCEAKEIEDEAKEIKDEPKGSKDEPKDEPKKELEEEIKSPDESSYPHMEQSREREDVRSAEKSYQELATSSPQLI
ncbi:DEKNAAC101537 [Brettanomyces naardenensis]|uniref:DEKNAAC101537 n=1 Tax=Brettanomyces naardenensis TaxID=13370 RepID=A0A448YIG1_BRENA|nr:DEKNAAC101537 [Brettanomyces naardenensis]